MRIGDEVYVHGFVDEIRKDTIIIRNEGGYFGTVESEVIDIVRCKECRHWNALDISRPSPCSVGLEDAKADDFCSYGEREGE